MELDYLWDTNIIIYYLNNSLPPSSQSFLENIIDHSEINISVITQIELLSWNTNKSSDLTLMKDLIDSCCVIPLDESVVEKVIETRRASKIKLPDSIIAASALVNGLTLLSHDNKDFRKVKDLKMIDPL